MPRPQRAHGRPDTAVIHTIWADDHADVIDRTHTAAVTITVPGRSVFDPGTRRTTTPVDAVIYTGGASIAQTSAADPDVADDTPHVRRYDVTLPAAATIPAGAQIAVDHCPGDPTLVDQILTVDDAATGSSRFARHLTATLT